MEFRVLLVGGGSGGHVYPLIAVEKSLKKRASELGVDLRLMMLGGSFIKRAAEESNLPYKTIPTGKLRRYLSIDNFFDIGRFLGGFFQSLWYLFWFMPDIVFVKGGADSVAPALVAKLFFVPVFVHESDSVPGLANIILGKVAKKVFLSFKNAEKYFNRSKTMLTGNPSRESLARGSKNVARAYFNLSEERPTIFIIGGSQGARVLNDVVLGSLAVMSRKFNIIHQCGDRNYENFKNEVGSLIKEGLGQYGELVERYYRLYPFLDEEHLSLAYSITDIIVSRAGSGLLFEIAQVGKPAIIVPIHQSSKNHQYLNALEFSYYGAYLMEENNLNRESLVREIDNLLKPENYSLVREKIKTFARPDAADKIAEELLRKYGLRT